MILALPILFLNRGEYNYSFSTWMIFGSLSATFLIVGILYFRRKGLRNLLFIFSAFTIAVPFLSLINRQIKINNVQGVYSGKDDKSNTIRLEVKENKEFKIEFENCVFADRKGRWQYIEEYDGFLFDAEENNINIIYNNGNLILNPDSTFECLSIKEITLFKKD